MKKKYITIFLTITLIIVGFALIPNKADAACISFTYFHPTECASEIAAVVGNLVLSIFGTVVTFTGALLNFSIKLTLNIGEIYNATPAIRNVWIIIRNISSILIIFFLLYSSIKTIIGSSGNDTKSLIGKIIMAGLLINFSLFFTKTAIDASNLISMQFYRAITTDSTDSATWRSSLDGGLSDVFMGSLKIQKIYHPLDAEIAKVNNITTEPTLVFSIIVATYCGIALMLFASISFLGAAIAISIRTGMLLLLMIFSPLYFMGAIFPKIKSEVSDTWLKNLKSQLLFMPLYLLLLYVALSIISDPKFLSFVNAPLANGPQQSQMQILIGVVIQYMIAILFINFPLFAAIKFGAMGAGFAENMTKSLKQRIYSQPKALWTNTGGRFASKIAESERLKNYASKSVIGEMALKGVRGQAVDYNKKLEEQVSARTKFGESLGHDRGQMNIAQGELRKLNSDLVQAQAKGEPTDELKKKIGQAKKAITKLEDRRKIDYATKTNTRSVDTLYSMVARKDKVAAAKLKIPIEEAKLSRHKDDLKSTKDEIKQLQQAITNNPKETGNKTITGVNGLATATQETRYKQLLDDQVTHTNDINTQEALLDNLKLIN